LANEEFESFSYSVSHDLKAPPRQLSGFTEILSEKYSKQLDENDQELVEVIQDTSDRMTILINSLLELFRIQQKEIKRQMVDLSEIAWTIEGELRNAEPDREIQFKCVNNIEAEGDFGLLNSVLENPLGNAWKFTSKT
jgi:signal transduction histidine kinase